MAKKSNKRRADGLISIEIKVGKNESGKWIRKVVYGKTQKEAETKADLIRAKYNKGFNISGKDTFGDWAKRWIASKHCSAGRIKICEYSVKKFEEICNLPLEKIKPIDIQAIIDRYAACNPTTGSPSARKTLLDLRNAAHQIFQLAIDNRVIDWNPADVVKIPTDAPQKTREPLSKELIMLVENTPHRAQIAAMIMLHAGLRRGELLALDWHDINLQDHMIRVSQSVEMYNGIAKIKDGGKTQCARRTVYIPQRLVDFLASNRAQHIIPLKGPDLVFPAPKGGPYGNASWQRLWKDYMRTLSLTAGYPVNFMAHQLRHTFATALYFAGIDPKTAQDQLGHAELETTMEIYTHLDKEYKKRSMQKLDNYYASNLPV